MLIDVLVSLVSQQVDANGEISDISLTTEGKYYEKAGCRYITYKETDLSGMEGTTTFLKIEADQIAVIRMGSVEVKQVFVVGKRHTSAYITPFGTFDVAVTPWIAEECVQAGEGRLRLEYDLEIDGRAVSRNSMVIELKRIENRDS